MGKRRRKHYSAGDQVNFIVTEDFVDDFNEFVLYCADNSVNTSGAMRKAIVEWLHERQSKKRALVPSDGGNIRKIVDAYEREVLKEA